MKILGIGGKDVKDFDGMAGTEDQCYIAELTETELDQLTGIAGRPHIAGRYKPGKSVNITEIYQKVKQINEKHTLIKAAVQTIKSSADAIDNDLPLNEE